MPIHFVVPPSFAEQVAVLSDQSLERDYPYWLGGRFNWVAQTWLVLRQYREGLTIGTAPQPGEINFAHVMGWRGSGTRVGEFRVSFRADYPRMFDVDFEILQNPAVSVSAQQAYLPYWPVPGLIPRDSARKGLKTLAYAGRLGPRNLVNGLRDPNVPVDGVEFRVIEPHLWHDLSGIDALVAIRSFDKSEHNTKPPSKLFSAWRAGVPLIAGWDSAFSTVGDAGVDYIRVQNTDEFYQALTRLQNEAGYYERIVEAGRARVSEVSHEAIAATWLECIDERIMPAFDEWHANGTPLLGGLLARSADSARETMSRAKQYMRSSKGAA
ncbi:glycosyltransferase [Planktotalea sp.]|uniref:glycosyltransferase n=1 Tax=Planktotalea sp. TaxID=2029877 RepID=UPI00329A5CE6